MNTIITSDRQYRVTAWGLLFILWGITALVDFVPAGAGIAGSGLILLGLNVLRSSKGMPAKASTSILGILALVWGGLELARRLLYLPFAISDTAIVSFLLIVLGGILLSRAAQQGSKADVDAFSG
jgi:hypothetical protein